MCKNLMREGWRGLKKHWGRIVYWCGVAAVVTGIAFAAEAYMRDETELTLPAVDVSAMLEELQEDRPAFYRPEDMKLLRGYTALPEWNGELGLWEAHTACDYSFADEAVPCLCTGEVCTIGESGVYGGFVEIDCGELLFRYASIVPDEDLKLGKTVAAGELLGYASDGMPAEYNLGSHLHLEVSEAENMVNFEALYAKTIR